MIWCYYLRFQVSLFLFIVGGCLLGQKCVFHGVILAICFSVPASFLFVFLHYWRLFLHPKEAELHPDRIVFKWKNKEKSYRYGEIKEVLSSGGTAIGATFPVVIIFYLKNGKTFELSRCLWNYDEFLNDLEAKGLKVTRIGRRQLTKEERKKYKVNPDR